jgi:esterase
MILNSIEQGSGPPLVLLHGLFGTAKNLGAVARGLSSQARVLSPDLRNHGDSPHDPAMDYAIMAADVAETMDAAGIASARVVGHSMGGKVAMMLALTQPHRVGKLVVMDIAPVPYDHGYDGYIEAMKAIPLNNEVTRKAANEILAAPIPDADLRLFLLSNLALGENPHILDWKSPSGATPYSGPALFLCGGNSDYVQPSATPIIKTLFPSAEIQTIEGAAHWLHAEQPKPVIAALQAFLF